jgi:membrane protein insertase Oxa1/YidC/SpoIIIJ
MFGYFALNYAVGLSIYWIVSTAAYIAEYYLVVGRPHPMVTAPPKSQTIAQARSGGPAVQPAGKGANRRGRAAREQKGAKQA